MAVTAYTGCPLGTVAASTLQEMLSIKGPEGPIGLSINGVGVASYSSMFDKIEVIGSEQGKIVVVKGRLGIISKFRRMSCLIRQLRTVRNQIKV